MTEQTMAHNSGRDTIKSCHALNAGTRSHTGVVAGSLHAHQWHTGMGARSVQSEFIHDLSICSTAAPNSSSTGTESGRTTHQTGGNADG